ncbi:tetratricopeptide repeat protein [Desulforhopalus vacuolatus]|uniref:tetratricopeptide repeat protein n=1 Tax=Desulforhopalus vacuolatus TaxID=40414 RepID=UPI0019623184|nr:tetratricopeptide repeat protein [Desulforhopalus vacuolatus]MBM9518872.1 tetratricopeptide repeat protein [Desulforhopalus vacuolatus]
MSGTIQPLSNIKKMPNFVENKTPPNTPEQKEYEEGKRLLENGNFGQAAAALHNALLSFEEKENKSGIANASNQLGHLCLEKKDYEGALKHYQRVRDICDEAGDRMSLIAVLDKRIDAWLGLENYSKALEDSFTILDFHEDNRNVQGVVVIMERIADIHLLAGEKEEAADTYRVIASIHSNFKHKGYSKRFEEKAEKVLS